MGAGRKTETIVVNDSASGFYDTGTVPHRNLPLHQLGSVIFGCQPETQNECLSSSLFGLPSGHLKYVKNIKEGMPLFLFNFTDRLMYGVFEATGAGNANINPHAWTGGAKLKTFFPAQVSVKIRKLYDPLHEDAFRKVIFENYYFEGKFHFELDRHQTENLIKLFVTGSPRGFGATPERRKQNPPGKKGGKSGGNTVDCSQSSESVDGWILPKKPARKTLAAGKPEYEESKRIKLPEELANTGFCSLRDELEHTEMPAEYEDEEETLNELNNDNAAGGYGFTEAEDDALAQRGDDKVVWSQTCSSTLSEWDWQAGDNCNQKQNISEAGDNCNQKQNLTEDEANVSFTANSLDYAIVSEIQTNMENCNAAVAKIRKYETELKHIISEARSVMEPLQELETLRSRNNFLEKTLAIQLDSLKLEVTELRSQLSAPRSSAAPVSDEISAFMTAKSIGSGEVFLLGGYDGQSCLNDVQVYSCASNQLRSAAPMLAPRSCAAATVLEARIFVFGGMGGGSWVDSVHMYEKARDLWMACPPMQIKRGSLAGVTVGNQIFALGGRGNGVSAAFSEVEFFDPHSGSWMSTTSMLEKRSFFAAAAHGGSIYAVGGNNGSSYLATVERFDPREGVWKNISSMSNKRGWLSAAFLKGKLYALGGFDGVRYLASAEVFDPRACCWEASCSMNTERALGASTVFNDSIYMIGGGPNSTKFHDYFECFHEASGWHIIRPDTFRGRALLTTVML